MDCEVATAVAFAQDRRHRGGQLTPCHSLMTGPSSAYRATTDLNGGRALVVAGRCLYAKFSACPRRAERPGLRPLPVASVQRQAGFAGGVHHHAPRFLSGRGR